jgi:hypothetical protein
MVAFDMAGRKAWLTPEGAEEIADLPPAQGVMLLPGFDPYTVAPISARAYTILDGFVDKVSRTAGWISPVLVVDGTIRGVWSHERVGDKVTVEVAPFAPVTKAVKTAATDCARRYATLLGAEVAVRWS